MQVEPLSDNMHLFQKVAEMKFQEFSYLNEEEKLENYLNRQMEYVTDKLLPKAYVVLNEDRQLLGTFTLKQKDFRSRLDLSPWLGSLVVTAKHRRQGVGAFMVCQAEHLAKALGYPQLYLYTPDQEAWYAKLGWQVVERSFLAKFPVTVMFKQLSKCSF